VQMEKHVGQREPRVSDSNIPTIQSHGLHYMTSPRDEPSPAPTDAPLVYGPGGIMGVPGPSVGRVPLVPGVVFAGSANGESLWALPNSQSPEASSDSASGQGHLPPAVPPGTDDLMADIDVSNLHLTLLSPIFGLGAFFNSWLAAMSLYPKSHVAN
jgi:hypothetical protein